jgi:AraC-like DNA-binding protein
MKRAESIQEFYDRHPQADPHRVTGNQPGAGHFNVFLRDACSINSPYSRRDFYKISLIIGTGRLHYADTWINVDRPALLFSNPMVPYSWETNDPDQRGWYTIFTEAFISSLEKVQDSPLFAIGAQHPVFFPDEEQIAEISIIYRKMIREINGEYAHKFSVLRNCLQLLIHEGMKMTPAGTFEKHANASTRISSLFLELLERQFPIDSPDAALKLKTANDYARSLSVHVNHLNRSVKEITGKTTTAHIAARITREATALLQHTDWNIAEIGYALGFESPPYFTNFFRKNAGLAPGELRNSALV